MGDNKITSITNLTSREGRLPTGSIKGYLSLTSLRTTERDSGLQGWGGEDKAAETGQSGGTGIQPLYNSFSF